MRWTVNERRGPIQRSAFRSASLLTGSGSARNPIAGLAVIGIGASLAPLDFAVNVAFPAITAAFALQTRGIRWVAVAYVLTYAALMLSCGRLGDLIGYRRVFRAGLIVGALAFVMCALAPSFEWLLAARVAQGVSAALVLSCAPALALGLVEDGRRTWALGIYASMGGAAGVAAPLLGGASIAWLGWAGVFWFRAPIALLALALLPLLPPDKPRAPAAGGFDPGSALLLAGGLALLLLAPALPEPGARLGPALAAALAGLALLMLFARGQRRAERPILPRRIAGRADFVLPNIASSVVHCASFAIPLLVPYFLIRVAAWGPLASGLLLATWALGFMAGSAFAPVAVRRLGVRAAAFTAGLIVAGGLGGVAAWPAAPPVGLMIATLFAQGVGLGLFQVAYTDRVVAALPPQDRGVAGSLAMFTRTIGIVAGASAFTWAMQVFEATHAAAGAGSAAAFQAAFGTVQGLAGLATGGFFVLTCFKRGIWFGAVAR